MKKIIWFALVLTLLLLVIGAGTYADTVASGTCGENVEWTLDSDGLLEISGTGAMDDYSDITYKRPWSQYLNIMHSLKIDFGVTHIGDVAFYGCSELSSIDMPDSVTSIGVFAFYNCSGLTNIDIPASITSIGQDAFYGCSGITSIAIPEKWTTIIDHAFSGMTGLTNIEIPSRITSIGSAAFSDCSGLTSIDIPDSVTYIDGGAFWGCSNLTSIDIPDSITYIGGSAFYGCNRLTSVDIPNSVTNLGAYAFNGCSSLTSIDIPDSITSIGDATFYGCSALTGIDIPSGITSIGESAFSGCSNLTSINIPDGITSISYGTFYNCGNLTKIFIPNSVTFIGGEVFYESHPTVYCYRGSYAETYATNNGLSIVLLDDYESDEPLFLSLKSPVTVYYGENMQLVPRTHIEGDYRFVWSSSDTSIATVDQNGVVSYVSDGTATVTVSCGSMSASSIVHCVLDCPPYRVLQLPDDLTEIGVGAFSGCDAEYAVLPDGCTQIGSKAFSACASLVLIDIPASVTDIAEDAFENTPNVTVLTPSGSAAQTFAAAHGIKCLEKQ